jgi:hypothetical protein
VARPRVRAAVPSRRHGRRCRRCGGCGTEARPHLAVLGRGELEGLRRPGRQAVDTGRAPANPPHNVTYDDEIHGGFGVPGTTPPSRGRGCAAASGLRARGRTEAAAGHRLRAGRAADRPIFLVPAGSGGSVDSTCRLRRAAEVRAPVPSIMSGDPGGSTLLHLGPRRSRSRRRGNRTPAERRTAAAPSCPRRPRREGPARNSARSARPPPAVQRSALAGPVAERRQARCGHRHHHAVAGTAHGRLDGSPPRRPERRGPTAVLSGSLAPHRPPRTRASHGRDRVVGAGR